MYAPEEESKREWELPKPRNLGWKGLSHAEVKAEAQRTNTDIRLTRRGEK